MLEGEIIVREKVYDQLKTQYLLHGNPLECLKYHLTLLDLVTAGYFAWSMTTARYNLHVVDGYTALRATSY